jgi:hypothetical protein
MAFIHLPLLRRVLLRTASLSLSRLSGEASERLLDCYEAARLPVAHLTVDQATSRFMDLWRAGRPSQEASPIEELADVRDALGRVLARPINLRSPDPASRVTAATDKVIRSICAESLNDVGDVPEVGEVLFAGRTLRW